MFTVFEFYSYLMCLTLPVVIGMRGLGRFDRSLKMIWLWMAVTLASELAAGLAGLLFGNNLWVYHLYTPVSFWMIAVYYNHRLPVFRKYRLGYLVGMIGIVVELVDTLHFHAYDQMDSYAIVITSVLGLAMVLLDIGRGLMAERGAMLRNPYVQISLLFGFFWASAALMLGSQIIFSPLQVVAMASLQFLWTVNIAVHLGLGYIFSRVVGIKTAA